MPYIHVGRILTISVRSTCIHRSRAMEGATTCMLIGRARPIAICRVPVGHDSEAYTYMC